MEPAQQRYKTKLFADNDKIFQAGFSTEDTPQCNIPSLVGRGRHKGAMAVGGNYILNAVLDKW